MRNRGFTLMELLVVVAIVAILAAMIMPVLLQAKEAARMTKCAQNLRQLGGAIARYMDDHDGFGLPPAPWDSEFYINTWILYVEPLTPSYIGQQSSLRPQQGSGAAQPKKVWICPGDVDRRGNTESDRPCWWYYGSSYLYPGPTAYHSGEGNDFLQRREDIVPRRVSAWRSPKRDILLADYWFDFHIGRRIPRDVNKPEIVPDPRIWVTDADVKTVNILFLDGHVSSVTGPQRERYINYTRKDDNPYVRKKTQQ